MRENADEGNGDVTCRQCSGECGHKEDRRSGQRAEVKTAPWEGFTRGVMQRMLV